MEECFQRIMKSFVLPTNTKVSTLQLTFCRNQYISLMYPDLSPLQFVLLSFVKHSNEHSLHVLPMSKNRLGHNISDYMSYVLTQIYVNTNNKLHLAC